VTPRSAAIALLLLASVAEAGESALSPGTRIRLMTGVPPWTEAGGVRRLPSRALREDEDSITLQAPGAEEALTWTKKGQWLVGELVSVDDRHLTVRLSRKGQTLRVSADRVSRLEISKGGNRARGGFLGAGIGMISLAILASLPDPCPHRGSTHGSDFGSFCIFDRSDSAALGAISGTVLGGLIGFSAGGERWRPVREPRFRVSLAPTAKGGAGFSVAMRF
jgi:hypothetical protein